ncbi:hypothetical protein [Streptomyces sp. P17]|uniref:DUF6841 family protein n=1 Tax=Streptomyces sp. P17 TaxID=3074716 RepID=UPI0028F45CCC|nr:hypothetical protein [Streptomyces sp. P17]MDT9700268.1 hypothetical protein [Streptomyces sp. P17]
MAPAATTPDPKAKSAFDEVRAWFFEDYLQRWVKAGAAGTSPTFITEYWGVPLWVGVEGHTPAVLLSAEAVIEFLDGMQTRLRASGYSHTVVPDRRLTLFHDRGAAIEVIWSRRRADESEIERLAVNFNCVKGEDGWRVIAIQGRPIDTLSLNESWPVHQEAAEER